MAGHYAGPMAGAAFGLAGDGEQHDRMILMTYPVDVRTVPEEQKATYRKLAAAGAQMMYYPGSIKGTCEDCGTPVYIGPNQQQRLRDQPGVLQVLCAYCAGKAFALAEASGNASLDIQSAGKEPNPDGIPRVFVSTAPDAKGYRVSCAGCGRKAYMSEPPGRKVVLCADCLREG